METEEFDAKVIFNKEDGGKTGTLEIMLKPPLNHGPIKSIAYGLRFVDPFFESEIIKSKSEIVPDYRDGWRLKEGDKK